VEPGVEGAGDEPFRREREASLDVPLLAPAEAVNHENEFTILGGRRNGCGGGVLEGQRGDVAGRAVLLDADDLARFKH
jgi:hypothetical protein